MPIGKLNLTTIQALSPGSVLWDQSLPGFGVRKNSTGNPAFILKLRFKGRQTKLTIGQLGRPWSIETARTEAKRLIGDAAAGIDIRDKDREKKKEGMDFAVIWNEFIEIHGGTIEERT